MTCIVGLVHRGSVYIGGDSASVQGWTSRVTKIPKVFRRGPFLMGYTTSFRMGQLLQYGLEFRAQRDDEDEMKYLVTEVAERVRLLLKERGMAKIESNTESGGQFLVGYRARLFSVQQDFQVNEMADGYDAVGSGAEYALGAIRAMAREQPVPRLKRALEISAHFNMGVSGPFVVKSLRARP
jgi:ATP-dependent protease HslVU (ClpYQ) peptidase subunit